MISLQIDIQNRENENPNANVEQWDLISIALNVAFPILPLSRTSNSIFLLDFKLSFFLSLSNLSLHFSLNQDERMAKRSPTPLIEAVSLLSYCLWKPLENRSVITPHVSSFPQPNAISMTLKIVTLYS